jgi:predicted nuclease of restriction endonuclease-like RecB superfamily
MAGKKTVIDGITFDSKIEADHYLYFKSKPDIKIVSVHSSFTIIEPFDWLDVKKAKKVKVQNAVYSPDFILQIGNNPKPLAVEVKGFERSDYLLRRKLFLSKYQHIYDFIQFDDIEECKAYFEK